MTERAKERPRASRGEAAFKNQIARVMGTFVETRAAAASRRTPASKATGDRRLTLKEATREFQLTFVQKALDENRRWNRWNIQATALALGVSRSFLYQLIEDLPRSQQRPNAPKRAGSRASRALPAKGRAKGSRRR